MSDDLERRVAAVEARLDEMSARADMEAGLRAAQDRDLSSLETFVQATHSVVQAIGLTQSEHGRVLREHTVTLHEHSILLGAVVAKLNEHDAKFDEILALLRDRP